MLKVKNVVKRFSDLTAVNQVNLEIKTGEFVALLGPNGAGKTTLVEMIEGIQTPDEGTVEIQSLSWGKHEKQLHEIVGISLQETKFLEKLKVRETMDLFASFYKVDGQRVDQVLEQVNLTEKQKSMVDDLSGGQRQRLAIGLAILNYPKLLLLDEPTTGLDPNARREIWEILEDLKTTHNTTLLLTTHYMEEADYLCERVVFMNGGQILADGTKGEILAKVSKQRMVRVAWAEGEPNVQGVFGNATWTREHAGGWVAKSTNPNQLLQDILRYTAQAGGKLSHIELREPTLEDAFIQLSGRKLND